MVKEERWGSESVDALLQYEEGASEKESQWILVNYHVLLLFVVLKFIP